MYGRPPSKHNIIISVIVAVSVRAWSSDFVIPGHKTHLRVSISASSLEFMKAFSGQTNRTVIKGCSVIKILPPYSDIRCRKLIEVFHVVTHTYFSPPLIEKCKAQRPVINISDHETGVKIKIMSDHRMVGYSLIFSDSVEGHIHCGPLKLSTATLVAVIRFSQRF